jgi:hypothetical protein
MKYQIPKKTEVCENKGKVSLFLGVPGHPKGIGHGENLAKIMRVHKG